MHSVSPSETAGLMLPASPVVSPGWRQRRHRAVGLGSLNRDTWVIGQSETPTALRRSRVLQAALTFNAWSYFNLNNILVGASIDL